MTERCRRAPRRPRPAMRPAIAFVLIAGGRCVIASATSRSRRSRASGDCFATNAVARSRPARTSAKATQRSSRSRAGGHLSARSASPRSMGQSAGARLPAMRREHAQAGTSSDASRPSAGGWCPELSGGPEPAVRGVGSRFVRAHVGLPVDRRGVTLATFPDH
jgi:hypothetical protein